MIFEHTTPKPTKEESTVTSVAKSPKRKTWIPVLLWTRTKKKDHTEIIKTCPCHIHRSAKEEENQTSQTQERESFGARIADLPR